MKHVSMHTSLTLLSFQPNNLMTIPSAFITNTKVFVKAELRESELRTSAMYVFYSRFNMPRKPLRQLRPELFPDSDDEEDAFDSDGLDTDFETPLLPSDS